MITELKENEIFVFGSNLSGMHGGGAANQAYQSFNAEWGVGEGLTGRCYAFPTMNEQMNKRDESELIESVKKLYACALVNLDKVFLLTKVGCGIAGYREEHMKNLFNKIKAPDNVVKPIGW